MCAHNLGFERYADAPSAEKRYLFVVVVVMAGMVVRSVLMCALCVQLQTGGMIWYATEVM